MENRSRFLREVLKEVKKRVGEDYPVLIKLSCHDFIEGGFTIDEAVVVAKMLEDEGIDGIEVSGGSPALKDMTPVRKGIDSKDKEGYHRELARRIKKEVNVPVILVGGLRSPDLMEEIITSGDADLLSLARPLIREPDLINRWAMGNLTKAKCISCNGCFTPGIKEGGIYCVAEKKKNVS